MKTASEFLLSEIQKTYHVRGGVDDYHAQHDLWAAYIAAGFDSHREFYSALERLLKQGKIKEVCPPIGKGGFWYVPEPRLARSSL